MHKEFKKKRYIGMATALIMGLISAYPENAWAANTSQLPSTGLIISGNFYTLNYMNTHLSVVQSALNNMGGNINNIYLDLNGAIADYGNFLTSGNAINNNGFDTYAATHSYVVPNGITLYTSHGVETYTTTSTAVPVVPASLQISTLGTLVAGSGQSVTASATVYDAAGDLLSGVTVYWESSNPAVGSIPASSVTNASGVATVPVTVGIVAGITQISASAGGITAISVPFTATAPVVANTNLGAMINTENINQASNDQTEWQQASPSFFVSAQTNDPAVSSSTGSSLLSLATGQSVYLFAYDPAGNVPSQQVTWQVNSPDATITPSSGQWTEGNNQVAAATFVATMPGVYTIQANNQGIFSVPLVLTVGMSQLPSQPFAVTPTQMGIESLPTNLPSVASLTQAGVTYVPYAAQQNWLPISGSTTLGVTTMTVLLAGTNGQEWSYRLPVVNGQFSGMVEAPFTGAMSVILFPHYFSTLTQSTNTNTGYSYPPSQYPVTVNSTALTPQNQAVLASAHRDYNLSLGMTQTAATLLENSPTLETAIAAISNEASDAITYNNQELLPGDYLWQDVATAWITHSGVCEDFSSLAAAMMGSVGIPTQTVGGWANQYWTSPPAADSNSADAHQWDQAWNGSTWIVFDPTWNTNDNSAVPDYLTSEFFTNTTSLAATHLPGVAQVGTDMTPRKGVIIA